MAHYLKSLLCQSACVAAIGLMPVSAAYAQSSGIVSGTVVNEDSGSLLPGAVVALKGTQYQTVTDREGSYRLAGVPAGTYQLTVSYVGFNDYEVTVILPESGDVVQRVTLSSNVGGGDEIVVQGYRQGTSKALNDQKEAVNIKNVISEEQIDSFPDLNTAEALQRVSGVQIQRANGEGRFVSIRGTSPRFTNVTINGEQVAFSNTSSRAVELDVVSAAQLSGIEVTKVVTPDMDASSIGGAIDLKTRGAFDYNRPRTVIDAGGGRNTIVNEWDFRASANHSQVFGMFGVSVGANFARTNTDQQSVEARWLNARTPTGTVLPYALREASALYSNNIRDRYGFNGRLDFRPGDAVKLYVSGVYNVRYDDQDRQILLNRFDRGTYISATEVRGARAVLSLSDRVEKQVVSTYAGGGELFIGDSVLDFLVSRSRASTTKDDGQLQPQFEIRNLNYSLSDLESKTPRFAITNGIDITNGELYTFNGLDLRFEDTTSTSDTARIDFTKPLALGSDTGKVRVGAKINRQIKERADIRTQLGFASGTLRLTPFISSSDQFILESGYTVGPKVDRDAFRAYFEEFPTRFTSAGRADVNLGEPYEAREITKSVYAMTMQEFGPLLALAGVRVEFRNLDYTATDLVLETNVDTGTRSVVRQSQLINSKRDYYDIFPNFQLRYRIGEDTNIRAAYSEGLALPNFFDATPYSLTNVTIERGVRDGDITRGNIQLDPARSTNLDLLGEHFFKGIGILSAGVFYKDIKNFTFLAQFLEPSGPFAGFDVRQFQNGAGAQLIGVEATWQQQFTFLPGVLNGFGIYANYTYTNALKVDLGPNSTRTPLTSLPDQQEHVGNIALTYERSRILSRLSLNYSGKYIVGVGPNEEEDSYRDERVTVDFSLTYKLPIGLDLFVQGNNLTNAETYSYFGRPTRSTQYALNGRVFTGGLRFTF